MYRWDKYWKEMAKERDGERKRGQIISGVIDPTVKVLFPQPTDILF